MHQLVGIKVGASEEMGRAREAVEAIHAGSGLQQCEQRSLRQGAAAEAVRAPFVRGAKSEPWRGRSIWGDTYRILLREHDIGGTEQWYKENGNPEKEAMTDLRETEVPLPGHFQVVEMG